MTGSVVPDAERVEEDGDEADPVDVAADGETADRAATTDGETVDRADDHLRDLADGSGCTEIWEHLSETRGE